MSSLTPSSTSPLDIYSSSTAAQQPDPEEKKEEAAVVSSLFSSSSAGPSEVSSSRTRRLSETRSGTSSSNFRKRSDSSVARTGEVATQKVLGGDTPLHLAAKNGSVETINALVEAAGGRGAAETSKLLRISTNRGDTPLHSATCCRYGLGASAVNALIDAAGGRGSPRVLELLRVTTYRGKTSLDVAKELRYELVIETLEKASRAE